MNTDRGSTDRTEKEFFRYSGIEFPEYLSGGTLPNQPLWTGPLNHKTALRIQEVLREKPDNV